MRKWRGFIVIITLLLLFSTNCHADNMQLPNDVLQVFSGEEWNEYHVARWMFMSHDTHPTVLVVMQKGDHNTLCLVVKDGSSWQMRYHNTKILRSGSVHPDDLVLGGDDASFWICYDTPAEFIMSNWAEAYNFLLDENNTWELSEYTCYDAILGVQYSLRSSGDLFNVRIDSESGWVDSYITYIPSLAFEEINSVELNAFVDTAIQKRNSPPEIPNTGLVDALPEPTLIDFPKGQTLDVYSGPGMQYSYWKAGTNTASTDGWIQVFGQDNGWLLIQYPVEDGENKFGYVSTSILPPNAEIPTLRFSSRLGVVTKASHLTFTPLRYQYEEEPFLSSGTHITYLASLGAKWAYIETEAPDGAPCRGFLRTEDLRISFQLQRAQQKKVRAFTQHLLLSFTRLVPPYRVDTQSQ